MAFASIPEVLEDIKAGKFVVLVDDEDRENEGDLVIAADKITPAAVNFMLREARGMLFVAIDDATCERLRLPPQAAHNTTQRGTAYTISVDAAASFGITTGVSAFERATTIRRLSESEARIEDFDRPGHIQPIRAREGGVLVRAGHTEAMIDVCRLAGLAPAAAGIEIMRDDGEMARRPELEAFCRKHGIKMATIADLISYRLKKEQFIRRIESITLPTRWGVFQLHAYQSAIDPQPHLALCKGSVGELDDEGKAVIHDEAVLVRVHSECLTGDVFGSGRCDCGGQLDTAMQMIETAGKGVVLYLRQEGRGIGLANKLHAYKLQEQGLDTVDANLRLGLPADKRDYGIGSQILRDLGLRKLRIMTNNPKKIYGIDGYGLQVVEEVPIKVPATENNQKYLATKKQRLGHRL
ncbi:MAG TPA: bifunctional 3,4-dihydroxy-2-butanone-4-phosphate synthase/GTP cyclohydrolase II [Tepidisphaeraceae bacterium]|nr:bifunctional 3,4-dihydroxy-2-butanone-4-phosphate synthase/GTP cyclohydrolase II [Tepidisphaeraceae bacterium]